MKSLAKETRQPIGKRKAIDVNDTPSNPRSTTPRLDAIRATTEGTWVRHALVDLAGDLVAGVLLSQIAYWAGWDRGDDRLTVERDGLRWLAKAYGAWWAECRVTEDQARRAIAALKAKGLVETGVWKFHGTPMVHIRLIEEVMEEALSTWDNPESTRARAQMDLGVGPDGPGREPESSTTTETTTKTTTKTTSEIVVSDDVRRLADLLASLMVENGCRPPSITKSGWFDPIRLLIEKDGVTPDRVERAIRWSQADDFWRANIHSGKALRDKFDTLRQQAARQRAGSVDQIRDAAAEYLDRKESA